MSENTKTCPFCGEEIMETAKKCKHCGEWLDRQSEESLQVIQCPACGEDISSNATICEHCGEVLGKFANLDINSKWKKRFEAVQKVSIDGNNWLPKKDIQISLKESFECGKIIYLSDIPSTLAIFAFGMFYYFAKGMWAKAIVYFLIIIAAFAICVPLGYAVAAILWSHAPFDYYRLKVLKKQW